MDIIFILLAYVCVYIYIYARWFRHRDDIAEQLRDRISTTAYRETAPVYIPACTRVCGFLGTPRICARLGGFHRARASSASNRSAMRVYISLYLAISMESPSPFVFDDRHCPGYRIRGFSPVSSVRAETHRGVPRPCVVISNFARRQA